MGQATVGQKAGVSQCDVSNWIRGNYMGYRNDHISAKFKEFLMGENFPLEASPDETEDLQERRGRNPAVVSPTNETTKEPAKPAEPAEPKADAVKLAPDTPDSSTPVNIITKPVIVQTTSVSIKVPSIAASSAHVSSCATRSPACSLGSELYRLKRNRHGRHRSR